MSTGAPRLVFLAGPNGAGKSTFYEIFLKSGSGGLPFVNADRITAALGISNREAAEVADAVRAEWVKERRSFVTETVFSDPAGAKLRFLREAIGAGYRVTLYFVGIASPQLSEARVFQRVREGGHDVPTDRLERRFRQSLENLAAAILFVPEVHVFDNSSARMPYRLVLTMRNGQRQFEASPLPAWLAAVL
ncbi:hypothetical protein OPIT5_18900 [Opitutaceae bacterium TAV5]|nr:hypothetical protein OPIT5_18900 [Opitutaceae bacterium TAV5]